MKHALLLALILLCVGALAEPLQVGRSLAPFSLEDQHGESHTVDASARILLFSRDMEGGGLLKEALEGRDASYLSARGALYLADISGMPRLIARFVALPRMRRRAYPMLLDPDGSATRALPDREGEATLVFLDRLRITRIEYAGTSEEVRALLEEASPASSEGRPEGAGRDPSASGGPVAERARAALAPLKNGLRAALQEALAEGPEHAIRVCRVEAPAIAAAASREGVRVGRTSHRLRNPANAPEPWMEPLLEHYVSQPEDREPRLRDLGDGRFGYVEPIDTQAPCLTCHGAVIAPEVAARLAELYPEDRATGFAVGELRGLFWAVVESGS